MVFANHAGSDAILDDYHQHADDDSAGGDDWVAVKELKLSYYIGEILLFTLYTHHGNLI